MIDHKLFSLEFIDEQFKSLNLRLFDGDKPSPLSGLSLTTTDSNLRQHGTFIMHQWHTLRFAMHVSI